MTYIVPLKGCLNMSLKFNNFLKFINIKIIKSKSYNLCFKWKTVCLSPSKCFMYSMLCSLQRKLILLEPLCNNIIHLERCLNVSLLCKNNLQGFFWSCELWRGGQDFWQHELSGWTSCYTRLLQETRYCRVNAFEFERGCASCLEDCGTPLPEEATSSSHHVG